MRFAKTSLRNAFCDVTIGAVIGLAGCGNTCFFGFVNTGTGVVVVGTTSPPPCSLTQGKAAMNAVAVKSAVCETCTADARVEHAFVTVQRVQLHRVVPDDPGKDWLEIAPELASEPRQVDLVGDSPPEILVDNANIPADTYDELRLRFCLDSSPNQECHAETTCGGRVQNCIKMADGRIEPIHWPSDSPELVIPIRTLEADSLAVLPDSIVDLQLKLGVRQGFTLSSIQRSALQNTVVGRAIATRR
jgi:hypothetical protein